VGGTATNVFHGLSRLTLGRPSLTPTLVERLCDERRGVFRQLVRKRSRRRATRQPSITWINAAWLVWLGLVRLGHDAQAAELTTRIARAVAGAGLRGYYDPFTGKGLGACDFSWLAPVIGNASAVMRDTEQKHPTRT
jgi:hypothetical protein